MTVEEQAARMQEVGAEFIAKADKELQHLPAEEIRLRMLGTIAGAIAVAAATDGAIPMRLKVGVNSLFEDMFGI